MNLMERELWEFQPLLSFQSLHSHQATLHENREAQKMQPRAGEPEINLFRIETH